MVRSFTDTVTYQVERFSNAFQKDGLYEVGECRLSLVPSIGDALRELGKLGLLTNFHHLALEEFMVVIPDGPVGQSYEICRKDTKERIFRLTRKA